jgi:activator of HSP90 ATPase
MPNAIEQEIMLNASPKRIYDALLDSRQFSEFTAGGPAEISQDAGGVFSCFGGMITGRNIELVPGQRIVQAWRAGNWPDGKYSIVKFELTAEGSGAKLRLHQDGYPEEGREHLESGWQKMYWDPLKKYITRA